MAGILQTKFQQQPEKLRESLKFKERNAKRKS